MKKQKEDSVFILYENLEDYVDKKKINPYFVSFCLPGIETTWGEYTFFAFRKKTYQSVMQFGIQTAEKEFKSKSYYKYQSRFSQKKIQKIRNPFY